MFPMKVIKVAMSWVQHPYLLDLLGISIDFWCQDQKARDYALNGLKQGRIRVLVATDVAARGLDIKGIGA